jgi:hypothetical protein
VQVVHTALIDTFMVRHTDCRFEKVQTRRSVVVPVCAQRTRRLYLDDSKRYVVLMTRTNTAASARDLLVMLVVDMNVWRVVLAVRVLFVRAVRA